MLASVALNAQYARLTAATVCTADSRRRNSALSWFRLAMMSCWRDASIVLSLSNGCENATSIPDCRFGSTLEIMLLVVVLAASHETLHVPAPHGSRCLTPVVENQSFTSTPVSPVNRLVGGVTLRERPNTVENTGAYAPRASPTRAASASVSRRTIARSGLRSTAR